MTTAPRARRVACSGPESGPAYANLVRLLTTGPADRRTALRSRIDILLSALGGPPSSTEPTAVVDALSVALEEPSKAQTWLTLAVLTGTLPDSARVLRTFRAMRLDGPLRSVAELWQSVIDANSGSWPRVHVTTDTVVVDVHHASRSDFPTHAGRLAKEVACRWARDHSVVLTAWSDGFTSLRFLSPDENDRLLGHVKPGGRLVHAETLRRGESEIVVPWRCTHLVPELPTEVDRIRRYQALLTFSAATSGLIGYDLAPFTASETFNGTSRDFALFLAAASDVRRVAAISPATALEFRGWKRMLAGKGQSGPDIEAISLPVLPSTPSDADLQEARTLLRVGSLPLVLVVSELSIRNSGAAILYAAEVLWREGITFALTFIDPNANASEHFAALLRKERAAHRPVQVVETLPDGVRRAAYRIAYCTIFPSVHAGVGWPVLESLTQGTPVITSNFGGVMEAASQGGALFVDTRSDDELTGALRLLLTDETLHARLATEAARVRTRTLDDYAAETWAYLAEGLDHPASMPVPSPIEDQLP